MSTLTKEEEEQMRQKIANLFFDVLQNKNITLIETVQRLKDIWPLTRVPAWVVPTLLELLNSGYFGDERERVDAKTLQDYYSKYFDAAIVQVMAEDDVHFAKMSSRIRTIVDDAIDDRLKLERSIRKPEKPSEELKTYKAQPFALDEFLQRVEEAEGHRLVCVYVSKSFLGMIREYSVVLSVEKGAPLILPPMLKY